MNLVVGHNLAVGALGAATTLCDVFARAVPATDLSAGQGVRVSNRFVSLLKDVEVHHAPLDFSCSVNFEALLKEKAERLILRLDNALAGIVTRVDVDNLCLLKLCINALVAERAEESAIEYACFAKDWCDRADFTDSVAQGKAFTATAEMFYRLGSYEDAARLFKSSAAILATVLDSEHPLTAYSRKRHKLTLTKLGRLGRSYNATTYGAGYLKKTEPARLSTLVWEGPVPG